MKLKKVQYNFPSNFMFPHEVKKLPTVKDGMFDVGNEKNVSIYLQLSIG